MKRQVFRKCVGCLKVKPKEQMIRFVKITTNNGQKQVLRDNTSKLDGRGAYLCKNEKCLSIAKKGKKFERSFKCALDENFYEKIDVNE